MTEPSVSIFGEPLTTTQLAELAAEACQMCDENTKVLRSYFKANYKIITAATVESEKTC